MSFGARMHSLIEIGTKNQRNWQWLAPLSLFKCNQEKERKASSFVSPLFSHRTARRAPSNSIGWKRLKYYSTRSTSTGDFRKNTPLKAFLLELHFTALGALKWLCNLKCLGAPKWIQGVLIGSNRILQSTPKIWKNRKKNEEKSEINQEYVRN